MINVFFHIIKDDDGNIFPVTPQMSSFGEPEVMKAVKLLNINFNQFNIFFKYWGMDVTNSTAMTSNGSVNSLLVPDAFNIFFMNSLGGISAGAIQGNIVAKYTYFAMQPETFEFALIHEIGHCFNLLHTFQNYNETYCEHVTRDGFSPDYNADIAGDSVADTPAQNQVGSGNFLNCTYIFNLLATDCIGHPYEDIIPGNFMGYDKTTCSRHFTPGQGQKMRSYLENMALPHYLMTYNNVESLYEPFYQNVAVGNTIMSIVDQPDSGGAIVCRNQVVKLRFQPGLDYEFSDTNLGTILQTVHQQFNYDNYMDHFIGVKIPIISDTDISMVGGVSSVYPYICNFEPYVSGNILSSVWIGSNNISIKELDEIEVKNPNLYDELMQHYYHIIKKYTSSGIKVEQVIYKN